MATIENLGPTTQAAFEAKIRTMDTPSLIAQECVQQGAIHGVAFVLRNGMSEDVAIEMLASLRRNMQLIREEAIRRGVGDLFPIDQTGMH